MPTSVISDLKEQRKGHTPAEIWEGKQDVWTVGWMSLVDANHVMEKSGKTDTETHRLFSVTRKKILRQKYLTIECLNSSGVNHEFYSEQTWRLRYRNLLTLWVLKKVGRDKHEIKRWCWVHIKKGKSKLCGDRKIPLTLLLMLQLP